MTTSTTNRSEKPHYHREVFWIPDQNATIFLTGGGMAPNSEPNAVEYLRFCCRGGGRKARLKEPDADTPDGKLYEAFVPDHDYLQFRLLTAEMRREFAPPKQ